MLESGWKTEARESDLHSPLPTQEGNRENINPKLQIIAKSTGRQNSRLHAEQDWAGIRFEPTAGILFQAND